MQEQINSIFQSFRGAKEELIPNLQCAQKEFGYLPEQAMLEIARFVRIPSSRVYAVATFYTQFRFTPIGRNHILVCRGTACHVIGAPRILDEFKRVLGIDENETTEDQEYTLETVACLGCCALAPCATINDEVAANLTPQKVKSLFKKS
jgi:NADH-quinone oxidoreductase subunit E